MFINGETHEDGHQKVNNREKVEDFPENEDEV